MLSARATPSMLKRIGLNITWLGLGRIVTQVQLAAFTILVARRLGAAEFGSYAFITTVVLIGNVFTTFGTDTLLIREIAKNQGKIGTRERTVLFLQLILSAVFIVFLFLWMSVPTGQNTQTSTGMQLYALTLLPLAFFSVYTAILRGYERMDLYVLVNLITVTIQTIGAFVFLGRFAGLLPLLIWLVVTQTAAAAISGWLCRATGFPGFRWSALHFLDLKKMLQLAWPFGLISLFGILYQRMGVLVLSSGIGGDQVGWFAAGTRVTEALKLSHIAVIGAILPALSRLYSANDSRASRKVLRYAFMLLISITSLAVLLVTLGSTQLMVLLFGPGFAPAAPALQILVWSLIPYTLSACLSIWEIVRGREQQVLWVTLLSTVFSLGATLLLVHAFPAANAAQSAGRAAFFSEGFQAALFLILVKQK
jgi:O-antigen/teichoic acid export membrane protein